MTSCTRLYNIVSINIGTEGVESLSSYIARLAEANSITTVSEFR